MKRLILIFILLSLAGCATTVAPPHAYFPENGDDSEIVIGGRAINGVYQDDIIITINGEDVLFGDITMWRLEDNLTGTYQGKYFQAYCYAVNDGIDTLTKHFCTVSMEGKTIGRLSF